MKIVIANPPNIDVINAHLPVKGKRNVIFTYGDTIYNPSGMVVSPYLVTHESVHADRQLTKWSSPADWWSAYLRDKQFRRDEEMLAYGAEVSHYCRENGRNERRRYIADTARRANAPIYDNMISFADAHRMLKAVAVATAHGKFLRIEGTDMIAVTP